MLRNLGKAAGAAALVAVCAVLSDGCGERSLPTAPAAESGESSAATGARMPVLPGGHRPGTMVRSTLAAGTTATPVPTSPAFTPTPAPTSIVPTATPAAPSATPLPPTPTRTPTPGGAATLIRLRAVRWAWQWVQGPGVVVGSPSINLKSGQRYSLHVFNGDIEDPTYAPHWFSGILEFGVSGSQLPYNAADYVVDFTAPTVSVSTTYGFSCMEFACGPTARHEGMVGTVIVDP